MENRYTNTLAEVPATIVEIREVGVPMGFPQKQIKEGFQLCDGSVVVDSMRDANGFYIGGAGMDGMYLATEDRYEPVLDDEGLISAFRKINSYVLNFGVHQQALIAQYALNTKANLVSDLTELLKAAFPDELRDLVKSTVSMLTYIPDEPCRQMMADLYWVYRERNLRTIQAQLQE